MVLLLGRVGLELLQFGTGVDEPQDVVVGAQVVQLPARQIGLGPAFQTEHGLFRLPEPLQCQTKTEKITH